MDYRGEIRTVTYQIVPRVPWETDQSAQPLQDADVIRHCRAAHVENAAELGVLDLHVAGGAGELHRCERVHRYAGGADRVTLGFQSAGRIDRQRAVLGDEAFGDDARA